MVEFVGPVLSGPEGIQEISDFLAALRSIGAKINNSCGFHINISHPDLWTARAIRRLIRLTAGHEQALWAINGSPTRENNSYYCKSIKAPGNGHASYKDKGYDELRALRRITYSFHDRYYTLNLQHVNEGPRTRRVEFRIPAGSVNSSKAVAFMRVFIGLVEVAIDGKGKPSWDIIKHERDSDLPDGVHALKNLFKALKWYPHAGLRTQIHSGNIRPIVGPHTSAWAVKAKGIMASTPDEAASEVEASASVLMKLARKYDTLKGATWSGSRRRAYGAF